MSPQDDPYNGMLKFGDGLGLADIWTGLHADAKSWHRAGFAADTLRQRAGIADSSMALMLSLQDCESNRWRPLIETIGITQIGAVAMSWCKNGTLEDVPDTLQQVSKTVADLHERTLTLLNPRIHPPTRSISTLVEFADQDAGKLAILVLSDLRALENDVSDAWLEGLPKNLAGILRRRRSTMIGLSISTVTTECL